MTPLTPQATLARTALAVSGAYRVAVSNRLQYAIALGFVAAWLADNRADPAAPGVAVGAVDYLRDWDPDRATGASRALP